MVSKKKVSKNKFEQDFSNRTVVIMLIVVVVASALSLGFYVNTLQTSLSSNDQREEPHNNQGKVSLEILERPLEESLEQSSGDFE